MYHETTIKIMPGQSPDELIQELHISLTEYYRDCGGTGAVVMRKERGFFKVKFEKTDGLHDDFLKYFKDGTGK